MEYILLFGLALFLVLVGTVFLLIFSSKDITTIVGGVMIVVIVCAIGFAVFMSISSITPSNIPEDNPNPIIAFSHGAVSSRIINLNTSINGSRVFVFWNVVDGVGCCSTFSCDYSLFTKFCGSPYTNDFKLFNIFLDGVMFVWPINPSWNYSCVMDTPWNYFYYNNVSVGNHSITIEQSDCLNIVDTKNISFEIGVPL